MTDIKKNRNRIFMNHYFTLSELANNGNESINERVKVWNPEKEFLKRCYALANIPQKYFDFEFEKIKNKILTTDANFESVQKIEKYLNNIENIAEKGIGLYITGPHGVAKTTIAIIIIKKAIQMHYRSFFCKSSEIVDFVRSGWTSEERKLFWNYVVNTTDFLVIDDIARLFQVQESERLYIDQIFTKRDDSNLPTIITSNHELAENKDLFGEALYSNFKERLIEVDLIGDDYRFTIGESLTKQL